MPHDPRKAVSSERGRSNGDTRARPKLLLPSSDLMLAARLEAPARMVGLEIEAVSSHAELEGALRREEPAVALLDCADSGFPFAETHASIRRLAPEARCIAIYPHVRAELAKMARDAGCELV